MGKKFYFLNLILWGSVEKNQSNWSEQPQCFITIKIKQMALFLLLSTFHIMGIKSVLLKKLSIFLKKNLSFEISKCLFLLNAITAISARHWNTGLVLSRASLNLMVPCSHMEVCPYSYFWWCGYFWGPSVSVVTTDEFWVRVTKLL